MLNISIITACIPSIKRFLADIQSGLMGVNISEPYELTHSGGKYAVDYGRGTTFGSKVTTRLGVSHMSGTGKSESSRMGRSRGEKDPRNLGMDLESGHHNHIRGGHRSPGGQGQVRDTSESVKGLTDDVIMQTIDYKVEYEDGNLSEGGRSSSGDRREGHSGYEVGVGR